MNSGNWNSCNFETGIFNSKNSKNIRVFNKNCLREKWDDAIKPNYFYFDLCIFIYWNEMTDEEKKENEKAFVLGGYLKEIEYKKAWKLSFEKAEKQDIELTKKLPNFNAKVFYEITGIDYFLNNKN